MRNKTAVFVILFLLCYGLANPVLCQMRFKIIENASDSIYTSRPHQFKFNELIIPTAIIFTGVLMTFDNDVIDRYEVMEERNENYGAFHYTIDDFLQVSPLVIAGMMELAVKNSKSVRKKRVVNLIKTELIVNTLTVSMKSLTRVKRPDSESLNSFPSGHTSQAFALATFLYNEYGNNHSPWVTAGGYALALSTGVMRILNGRHWISDVVAGAGVGMLSANLGCMDWKINRNKKTALMIVPSFSNEFAGGTLIVGF